MARLNPASTMHWHFPWKHMVIGILALVVLAAIVTPARNAVIDVFSGSAQVEPRQTETVNTAPKVNLLVQTQPEVAAPFTILLLEGEWERFGPAGVEIEAIHKMGDAIFAVQPLGSASARLWRTLNNGETWVLWAEIKNFEFISIYPGATPLSATDDQIQQVNTDELETYYREVGKKMGLQDLALGHARGDSQVTFVDTFAVEKGEFRETDRFSWRFFFTLQGKEYPFETLAPEARLLLWSYGAFVEDDEVNLFLGDSNREVWRKKIPFTQLQ